MINRRQFHGGELADLLIDDMELVFDSYAARTPSLNLAKLSKIQRSKSGHFSNGEACFTGSKS